MRQTALAPGGTLAVNVTGAGVVHVWATGSGREEWKSPALVCDECRPVFAPGGECIAVADRGGAVYLALPDGAVRTVATGGERVSALAFRRDGRALAIQDRTGRVGVVGLDDGAPIAEIWAPTPIRAAGVVVFDPAGSGLLVPGANDVGWYDIASGRQRGAFALPDGMVGRVVNALDLSADGGWLAGGTNGSHVPIWHLPDGFWHSDGVTVTPAAAYEGIDPIGVVALAPDASTLAVGAANLVEVFDIVTGLSRGRLQGLGGWITGIAHAGGTVTALDGGAVAASWDLATGRRQYRAAWREPNTPLGPYDPLGWDAVTADDPGWLRAAKRYDWLALHCANPAGARDVPAAFAAILAGESYYSGVDDVVETHGMAHEAAVPIAEMAMRAILDGDAGPQARERLLWILVSIVGEGSYGTDARLGHADLAAAARDIARPLLPYLHQLLADPTTPPETVLTTIELLDRYGIKHTIE